MLPRSAHSLLRLAPLLALTAQPACSVYDSSLIDDQASSSAAATSSGGDVNAGSSNGGTGSAVGAAGGASAGTESGGTANAGRSGGGTSSAGAGGTASAGAPSGGGSGTGASAGSTSGGAGGVGSGGKGGTGGAAGAAGASGIDPCSRSNWKGSASESSLSMTPPSLYNPPPQAVDGDGATRWSTGAPQVGGEWFLLDLGAVAPHLTQIVLDTSNHPTDYPSNYKLELSTNNTTYTFAGSGSGSSLTTIKFTDASARYLKITQTGTSSAWWSIQEISLSCQSN